MNDPPGLPSALGIEAVEWFKPEGGGENLTVRVTGRWRRRRPALSTQPMLVVEVHGYRHRYPAMPEPPSLTGTAPGTWRMTFSVPAWIAPHLGTRASLQFGGVVIPLPAQVEHTPEAAFERPVEQTPDAEELARWVRELEAELDEARRDQERLAEELEVQERARRAAEQRAFAEERLREDVQDELAVRMRELADAEGPAAELADALARISELEGELALLRRALEEAEHIAEAAVAAARAQAPGREAESTMTRGIRGELAVAMRTPPAPAQAGAPPVADAPSLGAEQEMIVARSRPSVPEAADGVRDGGSGGAEPPEELAATLEALRGELLELREIAEREQAGHAAALERVARLERELEEATSRSMRAYEAIDELRSQIEEVRAAAAGLPVAPPLVVEEQQPEAQPEQREPGTPPEEPSPTGPLEAARLEAALSRLREAAPTPASPEESTGVSVGPPPRASRPWLTGVLRRMLERDPNAAGRLVLALLPAQRLVSHRPLAYDLVLAEDGCIQVTVAGEYWSVVRSDGPRNLQAVQFSVATDLAGLARYVATGKARRLRRRRRAVISGDRDLARALPALVGVPLSVSELVTAGVRFDPLSALSVVALMIDPAWTAGERFTIAYQPAAGSDEAVWLVVRDGAPIAVLETLPAEPVGTTIVCEPDALLRLLDGGLVPEARVGPDPRLLTVLQGWMKRAQSG